MIEKGLHVRNEREVAVYGELVCDEACVGERVAVDVCEEDDGVSGAVVFGVDCVGFYWAGC